VQQSGLDPGEQASSQPTNWAWARRNSDSEAVSLEMGVKMSASSWRKSSDSTSCISVSERS